MSDTTVVTSENSADFYAQKIGLAEPEVESEAVEAQAEAEPQDSCDVGTLRGRRNDEGRSPVRHLQELHPVVV